MLITWNTGDILQFLGQSESLARHSEAYARANALSLLPAVLLLVLRNYAAAAGHPNLGLVIIVLGIIVGAFLGYGVMFGRFYLPEMGLVGLGLATAATNLMMFLMIFYLVQGRSHLRLSWGHLAGSDRVGQLLKIGTPIGLSGLGSVGTFAAATFFIALLGAAEVAGHAIAVQVANVGFAILWGGAQATTIRVGRATGARDQNATETAAWTGLMNVLTAAFLLAIVFVAARVVIVGFFLDTADEQNNASIQVAVSALMAVSLYQLVNGPQLAATSALRGLRDTTIPFVISLTGFWVIGGTFAGLLGFVADFGTAGVWFGFCGAVGISSSLLMVRLKLLLPDAMKLTVD